MNISAAELTEESDISLLESLGGTAAQEQEAAATLQVKLEAPIESPSSHYSPGVTSSVEEKALTLLGSGVSSESVANALGVVPARISQLLANKLFAGKVAELRYKSLQSHNIRDGKYDSIEDTLIEKLKKSIPLMVRPDTILKAISTINGAKRRGQSAPDQVVNQKNLVQIIMPKVIANKFTINIDNQVISAGDQELHTMPSGNLLKQVEAAEELRLEAPENQTHELSAEEETNAEETQEKEAS